MKNQLSDYQKAEQTQLLDLIHNSMGRLAELTQLQAGFVPTSIEIIDMRDIEDLTDDYS